MHQLCVSPFSHVHADNLARYYVGVFFFLVEMTKEWMVFFNLRLEYTLSNAAAMVFSCFCAHLPCDLESALVCEACLSSSLVVCRPPTPSSPLSFA